MSYCETFARVADDFVELFFGVVVGVEAAVVDFAGALADVFV